MVNRRAVLKTLSGLGMTSIAGCNANIGFGSVTLVIGCSRGKGKSCTVGVEIRPVNQDRIVYQTTVTLSNLENVRKKNILSGGTYEVTGYTPDGRERTETLDTGGCRQQEFSVYLWDEINISQNDC